MSQEVSFTKEELDLIERSRVARLATIDISGRFPHIIPICYIYDGKTFYTTLHKKSRRLRNVEKGSKASLLIDEYKEFDEQWLVLRGILFNVKAKILNYYNDSKQFMYGWKLLTNKYHQYTSWANGKTLSPKDPDVRRIMQLAILRKISWGFQ